MGILDTLRNTFGGGRDDDYDDYDDYDDDYEDGPDEAGYAPASARRDTSSSTRILGNTPRPEAESVSVYTRSGRPVQDTSASRSTQRSYAAPSPVETRSSGYGQSGYGQASYDQGGYDTPGDVGLKPIPRMSSGQLPPYVLKPVSYDDVQTVVRRVRTNQPVVIVFRNTNIETAKRILDFCLGLSCGIGGAVEELGDRVFVVLPAGIELSDADIRKLVADGDLER